MGADGRGGGGCGCDGGGGLGGGGGGVGGGGTWALRVLGAKSKESVKAVTG